MSNLQEQRQKISSTQSTSKITKAMEMVSAVKFRKFGETTGNSRDYMDALKEMIASATKYYFDRDIPLLAKKYKEETTLIILIGTSRGLVGSLINKIEVKFVDFITQLKSKNIKYDVVTLKKKTIEIVNKIGIQAQNSFEDSFENVSITELTALKNVILNGYLKNKYDSVYVVYTRFTNSFNQETIVEKLLPFSDISLPDEVETQVEDKFIYEESQSEVINGLVENYLEAFLQFAILNSTTSEYSARMVAMKKASDNAKEIEKTLKLAYNKERQSQITMQLLEGMSGRKK